MTIFAKFVMTLAFLNTRLSFFEICKNVKMAKNCIKVLLEIKRRYARRLAHGQSLDIQNNILLMIEQANKNWIKV